MKPRLALTVGAITFAVAMAFSQAAYAQAGATGAPATPNNGAAVPNQSGNGTSVPGDAGTQGTTDRQGSTNQVPAGTSGQQPSGAVNGQNGLSGTDSQEPVRGQNNGNPSDQNRNIDPDQRGTAGTATPGTPATGGTNDRNGAGNRDLESTSGDRFPSQNATGTSGATRNADPQNAAGTGARGTSGNATRGTSGTLPATASSLPFVILIAGLVFAVAMGVRLVRMLE